MYIKLTNNNPYPQFDIYDEERLIMRIKIDKEVQALRISSKDNRRVFFLSEERLRKETVLTLLNEYSQPLGTLISNRDTKNCGEIKLEGLRLNYEVTPDPFKEILLLENNGVNSVLNCKLSDEVFLSYSNYINYFIFALSWFALISKERREIIHFATA